MPESTDMMILHLPVKAKWYDMQESGEKPEEYREITPYWVKRLVWDDDYDEPVSDEDIEFICSRPKGIENIFDAGWKPKPYTHVLFRYGYTRRTFLHRIDSITVGRGDPAWGAPEDRDVFIIRHHKEGINHRLHELNRMKIVMREIKFRGFNRKNNVWLYGFYLQNRGAHFVAPDEFATGKSWNDYEIDPETLGQYINRKDKKDNDIYDGDILYAEFADGSHVHALIGWNENQMCWGCMSNYDYQGIAEGYDFAEFKGYVLNAYLKDALVCEVVGNVHDNPELLATTN